MYGDARLVVAVVLLLVMVTVALATQPGQCVLWWHAM